MSTQYQNAKDVPSQALADRLMELARFVAKSDFSDFSMRVPAELDRDADLVMSGAARRIESLQDEVNGLAGSLDRAETALQNLMSFLSVNGCRTEVDPENAELRIMDGIDMLVRPAVERAERAEAQLKELANQEPVWGQFLHEGRWHCYFSEAHMKSTMADKTNTCRPLYARPVPAAPAKFTDDELAEIHQLAYELGGTESGEYILDGEQLDTVIVKAASLFYKPVPAAVAVRDCTSCFLGDDADPGEHPCVACGPAGDATGEYKHWRPKAAESAVAVPEEWMEALTELADDLSIELDMRYQSRSHYPSELRKYENEMQPVYRARTLLQSAEVGSSQAQNEVTK